jgi:hypothetical protein
MESLEKQMDSFDRAERDQALRELWGLARRGAIGLPAPGRAVNLHSHTFYSYNAYGYSPSKFAWLARRRGLAVAGIVDFDSLDGLEEFRAAGRMIGLKACVSLESRTFVPEFADRVINSPGEPGIAYHMGVGFTRFAGHPTLARMRTASDERNRELIGRVNAFLKPVEVDFGRDVAPLTPKGNATERHIAAAYENRARLVFPDQAPRDRFWRERLGSLAEGGAPLQALIRSKTMKQGGAGYVLPGKDSFPLMAEMNRFVLESGAIPTVAWLDGTSAGEQAIEELFAVAMASGAAALNIIPDRNYTPGVKDRKLQNLYDVVAVAERVHFPVVVGTEMNAPGNKFVDDFETAEIRPLVPVFLKGAHIAFAHSALQPAGFGYLSPWAASAFPTAAAKNLFFDEAGRLLRADWGDLSAGLAADAGPEAVLRRIREDSARN